MQKCSNCYHSGVRLFSNLRRKTCHRAFTASPVDRASVRGTKKFVESVGLPLFHKFSVTGLYANPIFHGPPRNTRQFSPKKTADNMEKAMLRNNSNCVCIYNHIEKQQQPWAASMIGDIIEKSSFDRDSFICFAEIGSPSSANEILSRLEEALFLTSLTTIDFAVVKVDSSTVENSGRFFDETISTLERLCEANLLSTYGISANVEPYSFHTPALKKMSPHYLVPSWVERTVRKKTRYADLVFYQISPTTAIPATYPMLDPDPAVWVSDDDDTKESTRRFTRVAFDPLICFPGLGISKDDDEDVKEAIAMFNGQQEGEKESPYEASSEVILLSGIHPAPYEAKLAEEFDDLCPAVANSRYLEDKALRAVFSVGIEAVLMDSETSARIGPLRLRAEDMIPSEETDDLFGEFHVNV